MTGTLVVDGRAGVDQLVYAPRRHDPRWDRFARRLRRRRLPGGSATPGGSAGCSLDPDAVAARPRRRRHRRRPALAAALAGSKAPLKARLLDQSRVAGIGNLIADEVLWRAGLSPLRPAGSLTTTEVRRLHRHLGRTIDDLLERGGSHQGDLMDERHPGGRCPRDGTAARPGRTGGRAHHRGGARRHQR